MEPLIYFVQPLLICIITILLSSIPLWHLTRYFKADPLTRLSVSVLGGFAVMYLLEFGAYLISAPKWIPFAIIFLGALASAIFLYSRARTDPDKSSFPWEGLAIWLALSLWILAFQMNVLNYGAQITWYGDWFEHYERSIFFMDQLPASTTFLEGKFSLPARGPLFNANAGLLMSGLGHDFWVYQCISTTLNAFPVIIMGLLIKEVTSWSKNKALVSSAFFLGLAPFSVQQLTYTWTKFFAVGFILSGVYFYIRGCREKKFHLVGLSFLTFSLGILAHYMVLVPMLFFVGHFLYTSFLHPKIFKVPVIYLFALSPLLLSTWFGFSFLTFGVNKTLNANTAIGKEYSENFYETKGRTLTHTDIFLGNMLTSILPDDWRRNWKGLGRSFFDKGESWPFGPKEFPPEYKLVTEVNKKRLDIVNNQNNLVGNLGFAGSGGLIVALMVLILRRNTPAYSLRKNGLEPRIRFWLLFVFIGIPLNILPVPIYSPTGWAYAHLQVYVCLAALWILSILNVLSSKAKYLLLGAFIFNSVRSNYSWVLLHARPFEVTKLINGELLITGSQGLNHQYVNNLLLKAKELPVFLFDQYGNHIMAMSAFCILSAIGLLVSVATKGRSSENKDAPANYHPHSPASNPVH